MVRTKSRITIAGSVAEVWAYSYITAGHRARWLLPNLRVLVLAHSSPRSYGLSVRLRAHEGLISIVYRCLVALSPLLLAVAVFVVLEAGEPREVAPEAIARAAVWEVLVAASVFAWVILARVGCRVVHEVREVTGRNTWKADALPIGVFLATVYVAVALPLILARLTNIVNDEVLADQQLKNGLLHLTGAALIAPLLVAIKLIQLCAADGSAWSTTVDTITGIRRLRRALHVATAALGGIVASAVVATGALRDAVAADDQLATTPDTFVLVYGAWYTAVLGGIYFYAFAAIEGRARWFLERTAPLPQPGVATAAAFSTSVGLREQLTQELELGRSAFANLQGLVVILSPLLGAVLTRLAGL